MKGQKGKFGAKAGSSKTQCERLAASDNPDLQLVNYDLTACSRRSVHRAQHVFVRNIIEERKLLAMTARRAGWIGSKILLDRVPESGKIHIVQGGAVRAKESVLAQWLRRLFVRNESPDTRGWLPDVMNCVESLDKREFTLTKYTPSSGILGDLYFGNQNLKPKMRQQLQFLRNRGFIEFVLRHAGYDTIRESTRLFRRALFFVGL
jgi:hypothetical protein